MRFTGTHTVAVPRQRLWDALRDPVALRDALPGCSQLTCTDPGCYAMTVDVGVPCAQGSYRIDVEVVATTTPSAATLDLRVAGAPGGGSGRVEVELGEVDGATEVAYDLDADVGGNIAGVGQRLLAGVVHRTVVDHLDAVAAELGEARHAQPAPTEPDARPAAMAMPDPSRAEGVPPTVEVVAARAPETLTVLAIGSAVAATVGYLLGRRSRR